MALIRKSTAAPIKQSSGAPKQEAQQEEKFEQATNDPNAAVWDAIAAAKEFSAPEVGTYEAILLEIKILPLNQKGQSVQASFALAEFDDDGELVGKPFNRFFKILESDGRTRNEGSAGFFASFMAKLGYPRTNRGQEAFDEINAERPAVSLKITENNNPQFPPNATVLGRLSEDNENVVALREWIEANPF